MRSKSSILTISVVASLIFWAIFIYGVASLLSCSSVSRNPVPLRNQILVPMLGHTGLVYKFCADEDCTHPVYTDYDFEDAETRNRFIAARIICDIGGVPYAPCQDYVKIGGICNFIYKRPIMGIIGKKKAVLSSVYEFKNPTDYQKLIDAKMVCYNVALYPLEVR